MNFRIRVICHFRSVYKVKYISVEWKSSRNKRTNGEPIKHKSLLLFQVKHNEEFQTGQIGQHVRLQITPTTAKYSDFVVRRSGQSAVSEPRRVHSARRSQGTWEGKREKGNFWNKILCIFNFREENTSNQVDQNFFYILLAKLLLLSSTFKF